MNTRHLLMAAGVATLMVTAGAGAEAGGGGHGVGARAVAAEAGSGPNRTWTHQRGSRNAAIRQNGASNVARTIQNGNYNNAEIGQSGDNIAAASSRWATTTTPFCASAATSAPTSFR
jgi:hypothetical protein